MTIAINLPAPGKYDITLTVQGADVLHAIDQRLTRIEGQLVAIHTQGEQLTMATAENHALLDQINDYTNRMAAAEEAQTAAIEEIGRDIDTLIAETTDTTVKARLEELKAKAQAAAEASEAQTDTLKALAAKHDDPLPPPVEPTPEPPPGA